MILTQFPWLAAFLLYVLSSGFLAVEAHDADFIPKRAHSSPTKKAILIPDKEISNQALKPQLSQKRPQSSSPTSKPAPASAPPQATPILRPVVSDTLIPEIARGHEDIHRRFLGGKLVYKPNPKSDKGKIELFIRALANPLEGTFDLSGCGDTGQYLSISTGYRKGLKAENANKVEIWLTPWFLVNRNLSSSAKHLQPIMRSWDAAKAPVGLFWTWGGWSDLGWYDYLTTDSLKDICSADVRAKYLIAPSRPWPGNLSNHMAGMLSRFIFEL